MLNRTLSTLLLLPACCLQQVCPYLMYGVCEISPQTVLFSSLSTFSDFGRKRNFRITDRSQNHLLIPNMAMLTLSVHYESLSSN